MSLLEIVLYGFVFGVATGAGVASFLVTWGLVEWSVHRWWHRRHGDWLS